MISFLKQGWQRFLGLNGWVQLILVFCLLGACSNAILLCQDIASGGILLRLHAGFFILYAGQIAFIFLHEKFVWLLAVLQGGLALFTSADFTFMPLLRGLGNVFFFIVREPSLELVQIYKYTLISLAFSLQMLSAFALGSLLAGKSPTQEQAE